MKRGQSHSANSSWTQYVKLTAEDGTVSWIEIAGTINGTNIEIYKGYEIRTIDKKTKGSIDLNEVWSRSGGRGTHYQVTSIGDYAFYWCSGLTSVDIPSTVTSIGDCAFDGCSGLTSIEIPFNVTSIGDSAFSYCSGLTSVVVPSSVTSIGYKAFIGCSGLTFVTMGNGLTGIGSLAFSDCIGLTSVIIPSSVTSIGINPFSDCIGLTSIVVESGNSVYDSRNNCNAIIETASNTLIEGCKNTKIPSSVTNIGEFAFSYCVGLTSIVIPSSVTSIRESAFSGCINLTSVVIPSSVTNIGDLAFYECSGLSSIIVESGNSVYDSRNNCNAIIETASNTLIAGCKTTKIPSSVTSIGFSAFEDCIGLTSIKIPSSVTNIGYRAFLYCSGLTSVVIPSSVTSIGFEAFSGCIGLTSITSYITEVFETENDVFGGCDNATLYVPAGLVSTYRSTKDWSRFSKIEEIPGIALAIACNNKGKVKVNGEVQFTNDMGEVSVYDGMESTFTFQPNENCELRQVLIDGLDVTLSVENNQLKTKVNEGSKMIVVFDNKGSDVNGDGTVDISDVVQLVNIILGQ